MLCNDIQDNHREAEVRRAADWQVGGATHILARMLCLHPNECTHVTILYPTLFRAYVLALIAGNTIVVVYMYIYI